MNILRITARWSGFLGAPGYSNFFFSSSNGFWDGGLFGDEAQLAADNAADRVGGAITVLQGILPAGVDIVTEEEAAVIDSATGEMVGALDVDAFQANGGGAAGGYSAASGGVVNWRTSDYRFGRRIRGRTFIVPLAGSAYEDDGTLSPSARSSLQSFGSAMVSGGADPEFGVWSRPRSGAGGVFATAIGSTVPDMAAVLRSRRD